MKNDGLLNLFFFLFWWVKERKRLTNWLYPCFFLEEVQKKYFKNKVKKRKRTRKDQKYKKREEHTHNNKRGDENGKKIKKL